MHNWGSLEVWSNTFPLVRMWVGKWVWGRQTTGAPTIVFPHMPARIKIINIWFIFYGNRNYIKLCISVLTWALGQLSADPWQTLDFAEKLWCDFPPGGWSVCWQCSLGSAWPCPLAPHRLFVTTADGVCAVTWQVLLMMNLSNPDPCFLSNLNRHFFAQLEKYGGQCFASSSLTALVPPLVLCLRL